MECVESNGIDQMAKLLTTQNANTCDDKGTSLLVGASAKGHTQLRKMLLEKGALVDKVSNDGYTALVHASTWGYIDICKLLIESNAEINRQDKDGRTALMVACRMNQSKVCEYLLKNNAAVNFKDEAGNTALHYAVRRKNYDVVKLLIHQGADTNSKNSAGKSILDTAHAKKDKNIISCIQEYTNKNLDLEIEESKKKLKMLEIKRVIDKKGQNIMKMNEEKTKLIDFKNCLLKERKQDQNLQNEIEFLVQHIDETCKRLNEYKIENTVAKTLLQKQKKECEKMVETILEQVSYTHESISKCEKEIKTLEKKTESYEQQKHEYEFFKRCFEEGKYDNIIKEVNKECPICYEKMGPPVKIFQCSEGHLLCEKCLTKIRDSTKVCPYCNQDVISNPIRNRALEEIIDNETRRETLDTSKAAGNLRI